MIDEIGHFALVLALCVAVLQSTVPLVGAARGDAALTAWARPAAVAQFLFIAIAFLALMHAYAVSDFSLVNVANNSNSMKPLVYKLSGVWSKHEGSMLLWVFILSLFVNVGMWFERFVIICTSLTRDFLPSSWGNLSPTVVDIFTFFGTFGVFSVLFLLFVRFLPLMAMAEIKAVTPRADPHGQAHNPDLARGLGDASTQEKH